MRGGSRAGKRALVALRDALELDIDIVRTPATMAREIAIKLDVEWQEDLLVELNMVNLVASTPFSKRRRMRIRREPW